MKFAIVMFSAISRAADGWLDANGLASKCHRRHGVQIRLKLKLACLRDYLQLCSYALPWFENKLNISNNVHRLPTILTTFLRVNGCLL